MTKVPDKPARPVVIDEKGEFAWIRKDQLNVDESYQRNYRASPKTESMRKNWSWVACNALAVALRPDGEWFVIDGQNRFLAAMQREDITELPCMIFDLDTTKQEAEGFLRINTSRRNMTTVDKFKALLIAEDPTAIEVARLLRTTGHRIGKASKKSSPSIVSCATCLMDTIRISRSELLDLWGLIADLHKEKHITQDLVYGLTYLEKRLTHGVSLTDRHWYKRALAVGVNKMVEGIEAAAVYRRSRDKTTCALGIANALNYGLRNKLPHDLKVDDTDPVAEDAAA